VGPKLDPIFNYRWREKNLKVKKDRNSAIKVVHRDNSEEYVEVIPRLLYKG
jgi:hypothetical protein